MSATIDDAITHWRELLRDDPVAGDQVALEAGMCDDGVVESGRLLREGRTTGPHCQEVDLLPWVLSHRADLVLKPAEASPGTAWRLAGGAIRRCGRQR